VRQHGHRPLDAAALEVAVWRLAKGRAEGADEVRLGHVRDAGERHDVERLGEVAVHGVAGPQHPPVGLLGLAAHGSIVPHRGLGFGLGWRPGGRR
jgi:hypothetical protein